MFEEYKHSDPNLSIFYPECNGILTYSEAIRLAIGRRMLLDNSVLVYGLGVDDPKAMYGTTTNFHKHFGSSRCFDTPLSEDTMTGFGIGLAISGYKPIHVHQRTDFLLLCANQLINMAAKMRYLSNGKLNCPLIVRAITGRSWGQGSQHSQSFHSMFANIPGLTVMVPATPLEAFNTYHHALQEDSPTIVIEHRMLYSTKSNVFVQKKKPSLSKISLGKDITICSVSHMTVEAQRSVEFLNQHGISADHFSLVNVSNIDLDTILASVMKTKHFLFIDHGWLNCSIGHTIISNLYGSGYGGKHSILGYQNTPCPTAKSLENYFYPDSQLIAEVILKMIGSSVIVEIPASKEITSFKGPF